MNRILVCALWLAAAARAAEPVRILVVYDSRTGNTQKMAAAVRDGAASVAAVEAALRRTSEAGETDIVKADGLAVGTPVHWGNLSAETKSFLDRAGVALGLGRKGSTYGEGRVAGVFCTAGGPGGGQDTARLSVIAALLHLRFVITGGVDAGGLGILGPQAVTGGQSRGVAQADLDQARAFGQRLARLAVRFRSSGGAASAPAMGY